MDQESRINDLEKKVAHLGEMVNRKNSNIPLDLRIERLEQELASLKEKVNKEKYVPEYGRFCVSGSGDIVMNSIFKAEYLRAGRAFDTEAKAEKARDIMVRHDIILKYIIDAAPEWETDWDDRGQAKFFTYYNHFTNIWLMSSVEFFEYILPVGPKHVIEQLCNDLNAGQIDLAPHKNKEE